MDVVRMDVVLLDVVRMDVVLEAPVATERRGEPSPLAGVRLGSRQPHAVRVDPPAKVRRHDPDNLDSNHQTLISQRQSGPASLFLFAESFLAALESIDHSDHKPRA